MSVGDLIRSHRGTPGWSAELEAAYDGKRPFGVEAIAQLVRGAVANADRASVVDGGVSLIPALDHISIRPSLVVWLDTPEPVRSRRFGMRSPARQDDQVERFAARSRMCDQHLRHEIASVSDLWPIVRIEGGQDPKALLREALSSVYLSSTRQALAKGTLKTEAGSTVDAFVRALAADEPLNIRVRDRTHRADPVLLIKPGFVYGMPLLEEIQRRARRFGREISQIASWPGRLVSKGHVMQAHFDRQYVNAYHWSLVGEGSAKGAGELSMGRGTLTTAWEATTPVRLKPAVWEAEISVGHARVRVINGHIPGIVDRYESTSAKTLALRLSHIPELPRASWRALRRSFLGATRPDEAEAGSLRRSASNGELSLRGHVSFSNNAFHLSAGPLEALREAMVWLGDPLDLIRLAVDRDIPGGQAFALTAGLDWDDVVRLDLLGDDVTRAGQALSREKH